MQASILSRIAILVCVNWAFAALLLGGLRDRLSSRGKAAMTKAVMTPEELQGILDPQSQVPVERLASICSYFNGDRGRCSNLDGQEEQNPGSPRG
jgi:hypothetical protein